MFKLKQEEKNNMNIRFVYKILVLLSVILLLPSSYADCNPWSILQFSEHDLHQSVEQHMTRTEKEICIYTFKYSRDMYNYYMYTLIDESNKVVYCGITNDPQERTRAHVRNGKVFNQMVSLGYFSKSDALDKEKMCVCAYHPILNKLPTCRGYYGGGDVIANPAEFSFDGELYQLELE